MDLNDKLSRRININDIYEICTWIQYNIKRTQELYNLIYDPDKTVSYQALWVLCHFTLSENEWLYDKQNELIDEVLACRHPGKRRLLLNLLYRQPQANPPRVDFLNFCLERMISKQELPGVQTLCMKLAYELCRSIPELVQELRNTLEMLGPSLLPVSLRTVRKNVLHAMKEAQKNPIKKISIK